MEVQIYNYHYTIFNDFTDKKSIAEALKKKAGMVMYDNVFRKV